MRAASRSGIPPGYQRRAMDKLDALIVKVERKCAEQRAGAARQAWPGENGRQATAMLRRAEDHLVRLRAKREMLTAGGGGMADERTVPDVPAPTPAVASTLTPEQCRRAREVLGWQQWRLAEEARISLQTVGLFERGARRASAGTVATLVRVLEAAGVEFIPGGVRLRNRPAAEEAILLGPAGKVS